MEFFIKKLTPKKESVGRSMLSSHNFYFIIQVIRSCKTEDQLNTTISWIDRIGIYSIQDHNEIRAGGKSLKDKFSFYNEIENKKKHLQFRSDNSAQL